MWFVNATSCINGSKLFEAYDYETFGKIQRQYVELSSVEKAKYRGAEHYATIQTGKELTPLNKNFLKLMDEVTERLKSTPPMEPLQIDTTFQNDPVSYTHLTLPTTSRV